MPLYEYRCDACSHQFEKIQRFSDDPISVCPSCGQGPVVKLLSSPAIQFKGSGWYITDYARKGGEKGEKGEKDATATSTSGPGKGESGKAESDKNGSSSSGSSTKDAPASASSSDSSTKRD